MGPNRKMLRGYRGLSCIEKNFLPSYTAALNTLLPFQGITEKKLSNSNYCSFKITWNMSKQLLNYIKSISNEGFVLMAHKFLMACYVPFSHDIFCKEYIESHADTGSFIDNI